MHKKTYIQHLISIILLLLWIPVSLDKVVNYDVYRAGILMQPLSYTLAYIAIYSLPVLELLTVIMLIVKRYRRWGFKLSSLLMAAFTSYIGLALLGAWEKLPCGCGSVISGMSWQQHFWFNLFFLIISLVGWYIGKSDAAELNKEIEQGSTSNPGDQVLG